MTIRAVKKRLRVALPVAAFVAFSCFFGFVVWLGNAKHHDYKAEDCAKSQAEQDKYVCETLWEKTLSDPAGFWAMLLVAVTLVVTGGLVVYTARLWGATLRLGEDSERSIRAAEGSAAATEKLASAQAQSERAYILVYVVQDNFGESIFEKDGRDAIVAGAPLKRLVKLTLENYGKTPAMLLDIRFGLFHSAAPPDEDGFASFAADSLREPAIAANVRFQMNLTDDEALTLDDLAMLEGRGRFYYLQGQALYRTVFDTADDDPREATFCWRYDFATKVWAEWGGGKYNRRT